jgi:RNA polymerase subunit RPABC4/transcription elongation factor Spt4
MGMRMAFRCDTCGLSASVSGGPDCGFLVHTDTRYCPSCRALFDVVVSWTNFEGHTRTREMEAGIHFNECPSCHSSRLTQWHSGQPCPGCGGNLTQRGGVELWD